MRKGLLLQTEQWFRLQGGEQEPQPSAAFTPGPAHLAPPRLHLAHLSLRFHWQINVPVPVPGTWYQVLFFFFVAPPSRFQASEAGTLV